MKVFFGVSLLFALRAYSAPAPNSDFPVTHGHDADLVRETSALAIQNEASVQKVEPKSYLYSALLLGSLKPNYLAIETNGHRIQYQFEKPLVTLSAEVDWYLLKKAGLWGIATSLGYGQLQSKGTAASTVLHIMMASVQMGYRGEFSDTQKIVPYLFLGPSNWIYLQRGTDKYNTSESRWLMTMTGGIGFNLNRIGLIHSRTESEVRLQYRHHSLAASSNADLNSDEYQIGASLAL